jgi:hypothetical protein
MERTDDKFNLLIAITNLDVSTFPHDNPFQDTDSWRLLGQRTDLGDMLDEADRSVGLFETGIGGQKVIVRQSNYQLESEGRAITYPRVTAIFVADDNSLGAKQWDAYSIKGLWHGEWTYVAPQHAEAALKRAEQEIADSL